MARAALMELFAGPTASETAQGYSSSIKPGVMIKSLTITNGTARVDLNQAVQEGVAGACLVTSIRTQIEKTLKQFSTVRNVIIAVNGKTDDVLQP